VIDVPELLAARYEVLRTVSEGPRASVFQALDHVHENLVALKCFPVRDADRAQLLAESRLLMSLPPHQALPVVRGDFFTDDGRYVLVLNWVDGTDLEQWLDDEGDPALPLDEVTEILALVATALDHLHTQDPPIVHGDVKPANIIRTAKRGIVLVDFDIAGAATGPAGVGTVGYVAPEVVAGEKPTPAADVYGLAATAVSLLDGGLPSDGPPTYPGIEPSVRAQVARVLRSALAADPARRPRTAGRLVENLRRAQRVVGAAARRHA
jgi:serine/threonine protein kinase